MELWAFEIEIKKKEMKEAEMSGNIQDILEDLVIKTICGSGHRWTGKFVTD